LKITTNNGYTEAIIDDDCGFNKFYLIANILQKKPKLFFTKKASDTDTAYWDFIYNGSELTLHYNIYLGVSIFPKASRNATNVDNEAVAEVGSLLVIALTDLNWSEHKSGKITGPEGGTIILDIENSNGARITLEKDCGNIPFSITMGIYGLMMHTYFESTYGKAVEYVASSKLKINKIIEIYDDESRRDKCDKLIDELCEINRSKSH